jgi:tRNA modification GTPase
LKDQAIARTTNQDEHAEGAMITRARHRQHVEAAAEALERFVMLSNQGTLAVDMAAEELRLASSELGRITGAVDVEDVLDVLFSDFCIGK